MSDLELLPHSTHCSAVAAALVDFPKFAEISSSVGKSNSGPKEGG